MIAVQGTLLNVKLPHLKEEDMEELEKCTRELFLDSFAANRLKQTLELVNSLRAKTVTQQNWVKTVCPLIANHHSLTISSSGAEQHY